MQLTAMYSMWYSQSELATRQTKFLRRNKIESSILCALYHRRGVYLGCCAFMFKKLGSVLTSIFGDAIKEMSDEDEENKNKGEDKHE